MWLQRPPGSRLGAAYPDNGGTSDHELLAEDPFLEVVLRVEQQGHRTLAGFADRHLDDVAHFMRIGGGADRALERIEHAEAHFGMRLEDRTTPAALAVSAPFR